jgi:hypothetical protein
MKTTWTKVLCVMGFAGVLVTIAPTVRSAEMVLEEGTHTQFQGRRILRITLRKKPVPAVPLAEWPGKPVLPGGPAASVPYAPGTLTFVSTLTPEFSWPPCEGAASYKIYIARKPISAATTILAQEVSANSFQTSLGDFASPLRDGGTYVILIRPRDASGAFLSRPSQGSLGEFTVRLDPVRTTAPGEVDLSMVRINDISSNTFERIAVIDREVAPEGTIRITGRLTSTAGVRGASLSLTGSESGAAWTPLPLEGADFAHQFRLAEGVVYRPVIRIETETGASILRRLPDRLEQFRFINLTQRQRIQKVLDTLVDAYVRNDRNLLLSLIDRDYISREPEFRDYQELENSIRDQFNTQTTSTARWNTDDYSIVSPGRELILSFNWQQRINYSRFSETRELRETVRFNIRKINGEWRIHEDLDRKLFIRDLGILPAPPE